MRRDRTINFGLTNNQITETKSSALVIGTGYRIANVPNPFLRTRGKLAHSDAEGNRRGAAARHHRQGQCHHHPETWIHLPRRQVAPAGVDNRENQVTAGQKVASIKFSADLEVSRKVDPAGLL